MQRNQKLQVYTEQLSTVVRGLLTISTYSNPNISGNKNTTTAVQNI